MSPHRRRHARGLSLLETAATAAVLMLGILGILLTLLTASRHNRRNNNLNQATLIAEQELERVVNLRCVGEPVADPCINIKQLDDTWRDVWWSANGRMSETPPLPDAPPQVAYRLSVDVDPPFEGGETGAPALTRAIALPHGGTIPLHQVVNVRITVSWREEPDAPRRAVALQTRMAP
ncbi:type IV pilus modification PilV family protein [Myxococcus sp. Y35]|uniref:type IV pilus modification PilV family protein n=1 Tax=Pseudomyxococcus flavus TaxID=3115648 RepID=UPI003CF70EE5